MKKVLALLLCLLMLSGSVLMGCKKEDKEETESTKVTTAEEEGDGSFTDQVTRKNAKSSLPELNYEGKTVRYLARDREDIGFEINPDMVGDEALSEAVYNRNEYVKNTLNVNIEIVLKPGNYADKESYISEIRNNANGPDYYDIVSGPSYSLVPLSVEGTFVNIHSMDYIDTEKPWWNNNFVEECTYKNKLYMIEGELSLSMIDSSFVMYFNKNMFRDLYKGENLYDIVNSGNWTFETFKRYVADTWNDISGDGEPGASDSFGLVSPSFASGRDGFPTSFGATVTQRDGNGNIVLSFGTERNANIWLDFYDFLESESGVFVNGANDGARDECKEMFQNNKALFITELLHYSTLLRTTNVEYGVIPLPKYDDSQSNYGTSSESAHSQFALLNAGIQHEEASAVLELLCFETYRNVTMTYFESTLKYKNMRDEESTKMLDLIVGTITCNFGQQYSSVLTWPFPVIGTVKDISSYFTSKSGLLTKKLSDFLEMMDKID